MLTSTGSAVRRSFHYRSRRSSRRYPSLTGLRRGYLVTIEQALKRGNAQSKHHARPLLLINQFFADEAAQNQSSAWRSDKRESTASSTQESTCLPSAPISY